MTAIINADDFGLSESTNNGIIHCFKKGAINSTSLMANGQAFDHAVRLAHACKNLTVGAHITLVGEPPILTIDQIPSLIDQQGSLPKNYVCFIRKYLIGRIKKEQIKKEITAQCEKIIKAGIKISHIDSHQHLHMLPGILDIIMETSTRFKIERVRLPYKIPSANDLTCPSKIIRSIQQLFLSGLCVLQKKKILKTGISFYDIFYGFIDAGHLNKITLERFYDEAQKCRIVELGCHPGFENNELKHRYSQWAYQWEKELNLLCEFFDKNTAIA